METEEVIDFLEDEVQRLRDKEPYALNTIAAIETVIAHLEGRQEE